MDENTTYGNGYDLKVYGLDSGDFYSLHIAAISCIGLSLIAAVTTIVFSFRLQTRKFFEWSKSERFVVYLALCDALFNIAHSMDHINILATKDHVRPFPLCEFYGFMLAQFIAAQNLMVNIIAINAFVLIYFHKQMDYGRYDWKLLVWTFGVPFAGATAAAIAGQLGPNGAFCYFDGINGATANLFFTTIPLLLILFVNIVAYSLTWHKIRQESKTMKQTIGKTSAVVKMSHRVAKNMSLFVLAFFVQWWAMAMYGTWQRISDNVPLLLFRFVTTFSNIGGILNGIVFVIIRRRKKMLSSEHQLSMTTRSSNSSSKQNSSVVKP